MANAGFRLNDLIEASRRADSFTEVLGVALASVCNKVQAHSVTLLQHVSGQDYSCIAVSPERHPAACTIPMNGFLVNRLRFYTSPLTVTPADLATALR